MNKFRPVQYINESLLIRFSDAKSIDRQKPKRMNEQLKRQQNLHIIRAIKWIMNSILSNEIKNFFFFKGTNIIQYIGLKISRSLSFLSNVKNKIAMKNL